MSMIPEEQMEKALRDALRRSPAPTDFAAKVLAKTHAKQADPWLRRPFTLALAAAIMTMAIVPAVVLDYRHREEAKGLKAKQDLLTALAITRDQLQRAGEKVRRNTRSIR